MALFQFSDANDVSSVRARFSPVCSSTTVTWSGMWSRVIAACSRT
jgi:hypothetical protein